MATIKEVAAKAGVSVTTVSRALNNRGYLGKETRERIQAAMAELNYHPNEVARSLTNRKTNIIGVLVPALKSAYFAEVAAELANAITSRGYKMMLYTAKNTGDQALEYISMLKASQVDGIILCLRVRSVSTVLPDELPVVTMERQKVGRHPTILCDNEMGGRLAARELLDAGCRKPMMIGCFHGHDVPAYKRALGYQQEMNEAGVELRYMEACAANLGPKFALLAEAVVRQHPDVDGFFCSDDNLACSLISALHRAGKRVPEDVKVVGFNSNFLAAMLSPSLTSVRQNIPEMCRAAVDCLIRRINGDTDMEDRIIPVTLDRRESTQRSPEDPAGD